MATKAIGTVHTGDWSYSDVALEQIIDSHMHRFGPITDRWLRLATGTGNVDEELMRKTTGDRDRLRFFDYENCHIVLVQIDGQYRLLFWEGMNHLLPQPAAGAGDPKSERR